MKKTIALICLFLLFCAPMKSSSQNRDRFISYIEDSGYWYYIYDGHGQAVTVVSKYDGTIIGWGSDFFVITDRYWIYICDNRGKIYHSQSVSSYGEVVSVSSQNYVTFNGRWYYIFDKYGRKTDCRCVRK